MATAAFDILVLGFPVSTFLAAGTYGTADLKCPVAAPTDLAKLNGGAGFEDNNHISVTVAASSTPIVVSTSQVAPANTALTYSCYYTVVHAQRTSSTTTVFASTTATSATAGSGSSNGTDPGAGSETPNNGVSTGAAAGIGIGVAIVGILLGAAATWFCLSRRRRRETKNATALTVLPTIGSSNGSRRSRRRIERGPPLASLPSPPEMAVEVGRAGPFGGLQPYLPDGDGDSEIAGQLASVGQLITDHVQANYHTARLGRKHRSQIENSLSGLGLNAATKTQIATLAFDERTRRIALWSTDGDRCREQRHPRPARSATLPQKVCGIRGGPGAANPIDGSKVGSP